MRTAQCLVLLLLLAGFTAFISQWNPGPNPKDILRQAGETTQRARAISAELIRNTKALRNNLSRAELTEEARQHARMLVLGSFMLARYNETADHYNFATSLALAASTTLQNCSRPLPNATFVFDNAQELVDSIADGARGFETLEGVPKLLSITAAESALLAEMRQRGQYAGDGEEAPAHAPWINAYLAKTRMPILALQMVMERHAATEHPGLYSDNHLTALAALPVCASTAITTAWAIEALLLCADRIVTYYPNAKEDVFKLVFGRIAVIRNQFEANEKEAYFFRTLTDDPELRESLQNVIRLNNELARLGPAKP